MWHKAHECDFTVPLEVLNNPHIPDTSFVGANVQMYIFQRQLKGALGI